MQLLKNLFRSNSLLLPVQKAEKELLEDFMCSKNAFEAWLQKQPASKIRFRFFYPTAIDLFYNEFKLFTIYYKRSATGSVQLSEIKISKANHQSIRCFSWKPFEEVMLQFLSEQEESQKSYLLKTRHSLHEYASICANTAGEPTSSNKHLKILPSSNVRQLATG